MAEVSEAAPALRWKHHPFRERPTTSVLVVAGMIFSWWLGWHLVGEYGFLLALFATVAALGPYLFPTVYVLDSSGARSSTLWQMRRFDWEEFSGYDIYGDAVQLVLDPHSLRNRVQKGLLLPIAGVDRERLLSTVEHYLPTEQPTT